MKESIAKMKRVLRVTCVYHDKQLKNYIRNSWLSPFFTKARLRGNNINNLQLFLCEYVAMYYVWKNVQPIPYVGFCHYRRQFYPQYIELNENVIYGIDIRMNSIRHQFELYGSLPLFDCITNYVENMYEQDSYEYNLIITDKDTIKNQLMNECYICSWEVFNNLMSFIDGCIQHIFKCYGIKPNKRSLTKFISKTWIKMEPLELDESVHYWFGSKKGPDDCSHQWRLFAYLIEILIGFYLANYPGKIIKCTYCIFL